MGLISIMVIVMVGNRDSFKGMFFSDFSPIYLFVRGGVIVLKSAPFGFGVKKQGKGQGKTLSFEGFPLSISILVH